MNLPTPVSRALAWWKDTRAARTLSWYGARNGALLCGGIAYSGLFSLFSALTIGWTVFSAVLGSNTRLRSAVLSQVDMWIPGLITHDGHQGLVSPDTLIIHSGRLWTTLVAVVVFLVSSLGAMGALRASVRAMFDIPPTHGNAVTARLGQLAGFLVLAVGMVVSAGATVASNAVGRVAESLLGGSQLVVWAVHVGAALVGVVIDSLVVAAIVVLVGGARPRRRALVVGALAAGVVGGVLRWLGTSVVVGSAGHNALLAPFAAIVTILVLVNFLARVLLMVCAWMHDPPRMDEIALAEAHAAAMRHDRERERVIRAGRGEKGVLSPVVRGYRRATLP
ncbi:MAG: YihY/virulence factor BrkB family protein [Promicromonosporaceae bacterium]|nr:YihY/virulence factor BrkB family protein [Promicromonosporaceae bacterium]